MGLSCAGRCAPLRRGGKGVLQRANSDRAGGGTGPPGPPNHRRGAEGARRGCGGALGGSAAAQPPPRNADAPPRAARSPQPRSQRWGWGVFPNMRVFPFIFLKKEEQLVALSRPVPRSAPNLCLCTQVIAPLGFCSHPFPARCCANASLSFFIWSFLCLSFFFFLPLICNIHFPGVNLLK